MICSMDEENLLALLDVDMKTYNNIQKMLRRKYGRKKLINLHLPFALHEQQDFQERLN